MAQLLQASVTATSLTSNVATYTAANAFAAGQLVTVVDTRNGTGVFNVTLRPIVSANSTSFTVAIDNANVASAVEPKPGLATTFSSPALQLLQAERGKGPFVSVSAIIALAGSYVAGGVPLDLTQLYGQVDPAGRTMGASKPPTYLSAISKAAIIGTPVLTYKVSTFTDPADGSAPVSLSPTGQLTATSALLQVFTGGVELAAGAYPAAVLSDRIEFQAWFPNQS